MAENEEEILGVSVIICCYNSSKRIIKTLEHLVKQQVEEQINWEIIIVDNACTDNTKEITQNTWDKFQSLIPFLIVSQPIPGLSFAREKGIDSSKYEYLLFCDDDNWLSPKYINTVHNNMFTYPEIAVLGGKGIPKFEIDPPKFIKENPGPYAVGDQAEKKGFISYTNTFYGASTTYRKSSILKLKELGFIYYLTGRKGNKLLSGEDRELGYAITLLGEKSFYDPELTFIHFIEKRRVNLTYYMNSIYGNCQSFFILHAYFLIVLKKFENTNSFKTSFLWTFINFNRLSFQRVANSSDKYFEFKIWFITSITWTKNIYTFNRLKKELSIIFLDKVKP